MRILFDVSEGLDERCERVIDQTISAVTTDVILIVRADYRHLAKTLEQKHPDHVRIWTPSLISDEIDRCLWSGFVAQFGADVFILAAPEHWACAETLRAPSIIVSEETARTILESVPQAVQTAVAAYKIEPLPNRAKLALVSPVSPAKSGIADYTCDLLAALSQYYDITLIDTTPAELRDWDEDDPARADVRDVNWFMQNHHQFDRVVYQMGNSAYHAPMPELMQQIAGIVELHDFYLGDFFCWKQTNQRSTEWYESLLYEHGLKALKVAKSNPDRAILHYPANHRVFRDSLGVIVHSQYAKLLALDYVGAAYQDRITVMNLFRNPINPPGMAQARAALGIADESFIVCSFGFITPPKLQDRLIASWAKSDLAADPAAKLIMVGQPFDDKFSKQLQAGIDALPNPEQVVITGYTSDEDFKLYLSAANYAVQLRTNSRGETSGVVSHALNHGLPLIVNANGSFAEIDPQAAIILPDKFDNDMLVQAINDLYHNHEQRFLMAQRGPIVMQQMHSPANCAQLFYSAVESAYRKYLPSHPQQILQAIGQLPESLHLGQSDRVKLAKTINHNRAVEITRPRLWIDVTGTHCASAPSGIERVAMKLCQALIELEPTLGIVSPVYLCEHDGRWQHHQANAFMSDVLGFDETWLSDHEIQPRRGDILLCLDFAPVPFIQASDQGLIRDYRAQGVRCYSIVYDSLLMGSQGAFFGQAPHVHPQWLKAICELDGALCVSNRSAGALQKWMAGGHTANPNLKVGGFQLGADTDAFTHNASVYEKLPLSFVVSNAPAARLESAAATFMLVDNMPPSEGCAEVLQAFSQLWQNGFEGRLVIVGLKQWASKAGKHAPEISQTVDLLRSHPELGTRLWWLCDADDAVLSIAYACSDCLVATSGDTDLGLSVMEASRHHVPVLARDITALRAVAPPGAKFFTDGELKQTIKQWRKPASPQLGYHTTSWRESAQQVLKWLQESPSKLG